MQVILVKPVRKLGKVGDIVNVADGYGRNYLIPQELAIRATNDNVERFASLKKDLEAKNAENKKKAEAAKEKIEGKHFDFITQSAVDGRLFGSVNLKAIAVEVSKLSGLDLNYSNISLDSPIKYNGVYEVQVALHPEVSTKVLIVVAKTEAEAQDALLDYQQNGAKSEERKKEDELAKMVSEVSPDEIPELKEAEEEIE